MMKVRGLTGRVLVTAVAAFSPLLAAEHASFEQAHALFEAQEWEEASAAYEAVIATDPDNAIAWYELAEARYRLEQYAAAVAAYEAAHERGLSNLGLLARTALAYARLGKAEEALRWLESAVEAGLPPQVLRDNAALEALRDDHRFPPLVERAERRAHPCRYQPEYRQFDFWVGDWKVLYQGRPAGTNSIQRLLDGCLLWESWTSVSGSQGKSINYYDPHAGKWRQYWVDQGGEITTFEGELRDGAMHLAGENLHPDGRVELVRGTWTPRPDGSVRQLLERSQDGGENWYVWFDGIYVRQEEGKEAEPQN